MQRSITLAAAVAALLVVAQTGPAWAQESGSRQFAVQTANPSQSITTTAPTPLFRIFGVPFGINAPVAPPYSNSAYRDFAGQPATGNTTLAMTARQYDFRNFAP
jgi:hypothetical protein